MCKFYSDLGKTKFTVLRQSNIYGSYDKFDLERSHVFAATIVKVVNAVEEVVVWGEGKEKRDLLHVEDLVSCVEKVMKQQSQFELINVGIGEGIEISELVKKVVDIYKKDLYIRYDKTKPSFGNKLALDISRAKDLFGWIPIISIEEGIQKTLNHYEEVINE
jgi:nucleoside-diphosphate-sugar epimerase